ncbi:unnamed protein product [Gongylonema pulchrum]|uniref:Uncharacterized protein n=1 Tax=Gongylonema pulchrum TaxID=637853 RepID=A0A183DFQ7_9BILA|nr:unnamed protein product [Gongylonema pulchrum]
MDISFEIHSMRDDVLDFCGIAETDGEPLDIALPLLYTATSELFFKPANNDRLVTFVINSHSVILSFFSLLIKSDSCIYRLFTILWVCTERKNH